VTGTEDWEAITRRSTEDLIVSLALGRFRRRPPMAALPTGLRRDIRAFFGNYTAGCRRADDLLSRAGAAEAIDDACRCSPVGKLLPNALYIHRTALAALDPLLRVYEGCARAYLGEIEGANLIKLHRHSGKVSYLVYPDFDADPHPALLRSIKLNLRTREIESSDYATSPNPPVLHRKEAFLLPDDPRQAKFERLTLQEERAGLLDDTATIGTRAGWAERLRERGYALRGHRLVRRQAGDGPTGGRSGDGSE
jgi:DNA phosphorothioation-associated putative methyltransferase